LAIDHTSVLMPSNRLLLHLPPHLVGVDVLLVEALDLLLVVGHLFGAHRAGVLIVVPTLRPHRLWEVGGWVGAWLSVWVSVCAGSGGFDAGGGGGPD
jgi:hypothetical protein